MKIEVICVGKLRNAGLEALCQDYERRVGRHLAMRQVEVNGDRGLRRAVDGSAWWVVALEVGGQALSSRQFADVLAGWGENRGGRICFLIGGAEGLPREVSDAADAKLSLSTMTLPHRLARVLLCEQLYRAVSLWRGEPYARED